MDDLLEGLRTAIFVVNDLAAAKEWYANLLGYAPYFDEPFYVGFDVGGYELGLQPSGSDGEPGAGGVSVYWGVSEMDASLEQVLSLGATEREAPSDVGGGIKVATVTDPFGNVLGLIENPHFSAR